MATLAWRDVADGSAFHAALVPVSATTAPVRQHDHADFHELVYVTAGAGRHRTQAGVRPLVAGDLLLVRPHDRHQLTSDRGDRREPGLTVVNVAFPSVAWREFARLAGVAEAASWEAAPLPPGVHDARGALVPAAAAVLRDFQRGAPALSLLRFWSEAVQLVRAGAEPAPSPRPPWLDRALAATELEDDLRAGVEGLVARAGVTHGHLARSMRTWCGQTPVELVTARRLAHAALLLTTTTEPVGRVAERCGFSSQSYFTRLFTAAHGVSPGAYRSDPRRAVVP